MNLFDSLVQLYGLYHSNTIHPYILAYQYHLYFNDQNAKGTGTIVSAVLKLPSSYTDPFLLAGSIRFG